MPFTPYHFGPSGCVALALRKYIDVPAFVLVNVVIDLEPENPQKLKEAIEYYKMRPELIQECKIDGKKYIAGYFDREKAFMSFENETKQLLSAVTSSD